MGNQQQISELTDSINTSKNVIRQLGAKYEVSSKHYQQKANEFMPSHIKVPNWLIATGDTNILVV